MLFMLFNRFLLLRSDAVEDQGSGDEDMFSDVEAEAGGDDQDEGKF